MVEKNINQLLVLAIHKHGKNRVFYIPKQLDKLIPVNSTLAEIEVKKIIA